MNGAQIHPNANSLLKAVYQSRLRLTRLLLEGGAYINESNEHGETPLMIACKSRHADNQGAAKTKMVGYLLESGADPNIQDKSGKTALMHACVEHAGHEVVCSLLANGADPGLEDHAGNATLIHAINSGDEVTVKLLMDAFRAKGKEVIIITMERQDDGKLTARQYLKVPPTTEVDLWNKLQSSWVPCASPSEVHLSTSPQVSLSTKPTFSFQDLQTVPCFPSKPSLVNRTMNKAHHLQRLHSEPWLKIPQSFLTQHQAKGSAPVEELPDITPEEELTYRMDRLGFDSLKQASSLNQIQPPGNPNSEGLRPEGALCRNKSFNGLSSLYSLSHPNLHSRVSAECAPDHDIEKTVPNLAVSSLCNIIQRRTLGMEHYGSDSQLSVAGNFPGEGRRQPDRKQLVTSRSSTVISAEESSQNNLLVNTQKRHSVTLERKAPDTVLLDSTSNPRLGFLPPLNHSAPTTQLTGACSGTTASSGNKGTYGMSGIKQYLPSAPAGLPKGLKIRRMLTRRHSIQTEQIKQLGEFKYQ